MAIFKVEEVATGNVETDGWFYSLVGIDDIIGPFKSKRDALTKAHKSVTNDIAHYNKLLKAIETELEA